MLNRGQVENIHLGIKRDWDEAIFGGWRELDDIVYQTARKRFWNDVRKWKNVIAKIVSSVVVVENQLR